MVYSPTKFSDDRQTNFKLSHGNNINNGTSGKEKFFQRKRNMEIRGIIQKLQLDITEKKKKRKEKKKTSRIVQTSLF